VISSNNKLQLKFPIIPKMQLNFETKVNTVDWKLKLSPLFAKGYHPSS